MARQVLSAFSHWLGSIQRAKISLSAFESLASQDVAGFRDNEMAALGQQNPYQCDQCGTSNIVAVPLLYEQGTRTYSGPFHQGSSQSYSAQVAAPPKPRSYARPLFLWGFAIFFFGFWACAGFSAHFKYPNDSSMAHTIAFLLILGLACAGGLVLNLRRVSRYNREVYSRLYWDWEHTYQCRRCGKVLVIPI